MLGVLSGCGANRTHADAAPSPDAIVWRYEVSSTLATVESLSVEGLFARGASDEFGIDADAAPYVRDVQFASGALWMPARVDGSGWSVPCRSAGCRVRYRFALKDAATEIDDATTAIASGGAFIAPPSTWLLHPDVQPGRFQYHVHVPEPAGFASGTRRSPGGGSNTFEASTEALEDSSFAVFGDFQSRSIQNGAARIDIAVAPHALALSEGEAVAWVTSAVRAIALYYGRFPVTRALVILIQGKAARETRGETLGDGGPAVLIRVGSGVTPASVGDDWVMTHELLHVTLPTFAREHVWLSEGLPTYVEPLARARAGLLAPEKLWADLVEGLPQGLPGSGDRGLENTHTWGRTYWGGALFCLLADVTIRERTANARSLDDALRAVVSTGADVEVRWSIDQFLEIGDRATGTTVLRDLYRTLGLEPGSVDLATLWARLGVRARDGRATFDETAPLASLRRSMTAPPDDPARR